MQTIPQAETENTQEKIDKDSEANIPKAKIVEEIGGAKGPEPTRYGDWEHNGRCTDF